MRLAWLLSALIFALLLAVSEFYALSHFLYWKIRWIDTPMHLLGGVTLGLLLAPLVWERRVLYVLGVSLLFIAWEVFEFTIDVPQQQGSYLIDTAHDLINDALGAGLIYLIARKTVWQSV